MTVTETPRKSILTRAGGYLKQVCSHSLNPWTGCGFGKSSCGSACYVQFNNWLTKGRRWGEFVDVKINAAEVYLKTRDTEKRWANKKGLPFSVFMSSSTEPWQPLEKKYRLTRGILQAMLSSPPDRLILQTHSVLILDDMELIGDLSRKCELRVHISIESDRDNLPGLPAPPSPVDARIDVLQKFSQSGIKTVACVSPLYPINDPPSFFARLAKAGAGAAVIDHFIEGDGTPDGSRTRKTPLLSAMVKVNDQAGDLSYRDAIADIARNYLPVGISADGFAGNYLS